MSVGLQTTKGELTNLPTVYSEKKVIKRTLGVFFCKKKQVINQKEIYIAAGVLMIEGTRQVFVRGKALYHVLTLSSWSAVVNDWNDHQLLLYKIYHSIGIVLLRTFRVEGSTRGRPASRTEIVILHHVPIAGTTFTVATRTKPVRRKSGIAGATYYSFIQLYSLPCR